MNRIDKTVVFKTLRDEHLAQILDNQAAELRRASR
jgi:ATP-dependent Clp protease ATP-binding subunit ClpA